MDERSVASPRAELPPALSRRVARFQAMFAAARKRGRYLWHRTSSSAPGSHVRVDGKDVLHLASYDALGLAHHPEVLERVALEVGRLGLAHGGSPLICGRTPLHEALEERLARVAGTEDCALFASGYQANAGVLGALLRRGDGALIDRMAHPSLVDGVRSSGAPWRTFEHNQADDLALQRAELSASSSPRSIAVLVDGVYSTRGDLADLEALAPVVEADERSFLVVDDAHGFGVLGEHGGGVIERTNSHDSVAVLTASMKSLPGNGGFACAAREVLDLIRHTARAYVFSGGLAVADAAAALAGLDVLEREPERRARALRNTQVFCSELARHGVKTLPTNSTITVIPTVTQEATLEIAARWFEDGVLCAPMVPPSTAPGRCVVRVHCTALHDESELRKAALGLAQGGVIEAQRGR